MVSNLCVYKRYRGYNLYKTNDGSSFYAYAYATDDVGVTRVEFPTWSSIGEHQDDIIWHKGEYGSVTDKDGLTYTAKVVVK